MTAQPTALHTYLQRLPMILDKIEARRQLAGEHIGHAPDAIHWGHVGDLGQVDQALDELLAIFDGQTRWRGATRSTGGRNPARRGISGKKKGPEIIRALVYGGLAALERSLEIVDKSEKTRVQNHLEPRLVPHPLESLR